MVLNLELEKINVTDVEFRTGEDSNFDNYGCNIFLLTLYFEM